MPSRCVAGFCSITHKDGVSLFRFPKDPELRSKWVKQVRCTRAEWEPSPSLVTTERLQEIAGQRKVLPDERDLKVSCKEELEPPSHKEEEEEEEGEAPTLLLNVIVKSEDDGANSPCQEPLTNGSILVMKTEADEAELQSESDNSEDWCETSHPQSARGKSRKWLDCNNKSLTCSVCKKIFKSKSARTRHIKSCGSCFFCGISFCQTRHLKTHLGNHKSPFCFLECWKCINHAQGVNRQMKIHTGDKPFFCSMCGRCFYQSHRHHYKKEAMLSSGGLIRGLALPPVGRRVHNDLSAQR